MTITLVVIAFVFVYICVVCKNESLEEGYSEAHSFFYGLFWGCIYLVGCGLLWVFLNHLRG